MLLTQLMFLLLLLILALLVLYEAFLQPQLYFLPLQLTSEIPNLSPLERLSLTTSCISASICSPRLHHHLRLQLRLRLPLLRIVLCLGYFG